MKKRCVVYTGLLAVVVAIAFFIFYFLQPVHEGKSANEWLSILGDYTRSVDERRPAWNAFKMMGVKAIPQIIREGRRIDSPFQKRYDEIWKKLPQFAKLFIPKPLDDIERSKLETGVSSALRATGPKGIPILIKSTNDSSAFVRGVSIIRLSGFYKDGHDISDYPEPIEIIQIFIERLDDPETSVQRYALQALINIGVPSDAVLTRLHEVSENDQAQTTFEVSQAIRATIGIWELSGEAAYPIRRLIMLWPKAGPPLQLTILETFAEMGPVAVDAIPFLTKLMKQGEPRAF